MIFAKRKFFGVSTINPSVSHEITVNEIRIVDYNIYNIKKDCNTSELLLRRYSHGTWIDPDGEVWTDWILK